MIETDEAQPEPELVYIAAKLEEAKKLETIFEEHGIGYEVRVEQYRAGVIFASTRAGAFFYVEPEEAGRARELLTGLGYRVQGPFQ